MRRRRWALTFPLLPLGACWLGTRWPTIATAREARETVGRWFNQTWEFFDALEIWNAPSLQEDKRPEAVELASLVEQMLTLTNGTKPASSADATAAAKDKKSKKEVARILGLLPAATLAYYRMRFTSVFEKPQVKRGLSSTVVYANLALLAVFARVVAPRLLAADNLDEFFEAVEPLGVPDRASLMGILQSIADYDTALKITLYIAAFIVEKLLMLTEFLPIQIALKTLAPIIFGGLVQGALASATTETIAACCNFIIGRNFFKDKLEGFSVFGSEPLGKALWFNKLQKAAKEDGARLSLLLRLSPVLPIPFDSYWYLLGALPVELWDFAAAHFAGCLKTAFLDASFGMLLLTSVGNDGSVVQSQAQQIVLVESVAFAIVAVLVSTVATRLINELLGLDEEEPQEPPPKVAKRCD
ncbi:Hypothetical protein SCF082_LOCUS14009 [Durusdinium trenchii]|uniref:VTT domain-containing protein n=1 Tax=Durusdinium trenchii TaxID=1381693 RepID=A0ABP0JVC9_9DINO